MLKWSRFGDVPRKGLPPGYVMSTRVRVIDDKVVCGTTRQHANGYAE